MPAAQPPSRNRFFAALLRGTRALLAHMLGVQRPTVSHAANALRRAGLIDYRRTRITILHRRRLERRACECYRALHDLYAQLVEPLL